MNHSIFIDGGAGRVITAIPALEAFVKAHSEDTIKIFVGGWDSLFWNNKLLQNIVFPIQQKGNWEFIRNSKRWMPEPYHHQGYIDGTHHLTEAFAELLQVELETKVPNLYTWSIEDNKVRSLIANTKRPPNSPIVVIQPYGSGMKLEGAKPMDSGSRSLDVDQYLELVKNLSRDHTLVFFGDKNLEHPGDKYTIKVSEMNPDHRFFMSLIKQADYFIGVDSLGQHIARAFDIPGTIIMGSTREQNVSYPDHFNIIRKQDQEPVYVPIRFPLMDAEFTERQNDGIMDFTQKEITDIAENIRKHARSV